MASQEPNITLTSVLTCPHCGHTEALRMPTDSCQWMLTCNACAEVIRPLPGDCCVFCSYGLVTCPPVQVQGE